MFLDPDFIKSKVVNLVLHFLTSFLSYEKLDEENFILKIIIFNVSLSAE